MIAVAKERAKRFGSKVHFVNVGLDETFGNLTFYVTKSLIHSSMDYFKALANDPQPSAITVPTIRCESLWALTNHSAPYFVKIDIEERHFVCVEAITRLPRAQQPQYVSWEMHEFARGLPFPELDTELASKLKTQGYLRMKIASNIAHGGASSGGLMPEEVVDVETQRKEWVSTDENLAHGIPQARSWRNRKDW